MALKRIYGDILKGFVIEIDIPDDATADQIEELVHEELWGAHDAAEGDGIRIDDIEDT
jgi:hypothetical protein